MIVQDRKPRHGHREDFRKFLEPMFDPAFPVVHSFPERVRSQKGVILIQP